MICALYTLKKEIRDKKIYVWNINRNSMVVFTRLLFMRVNIEGFVVTQKEYVGESYMNRPILDFEQIMRNENAVILVHDIVPKDFVQGLHSNNIIYYSEALAVNEELYQKRIIIYGTGGGADHVQEVLREKGMVPEYYCVTQRGGITQFRGKKVIEVTELNNYKDFVVIVSVWKDEYRKQILELLLDLDYSGDIYIEHIISDIGILHINLIQSLDDAIKKQKKIYLYSKRNVMAKLLEEALLIYGIEVSGYVSGIRNDDEKITCIYELVYDGIKDTLIILNEENPRNLIRIRENVEFAGFSLEQGNYTSLQYYTRAKETMMLELRTCPDPLLGYSMIYPKGEHGWKIYGKEEKGKTRILVLGGSTSAEVWHPENWISKLYTKLRRSGFDVVIYNGAHEANDIVSEVLRLLRDGSVLRPQIVISMSGVNNLHYKDSLSQFSDERLISWVKHLSNKGLCCSGLYNNESLYSFWDRNEKVLDVISGFYGARLLCFLQPMNITMAHMSIHEKSIYEEEQHVGAGDFFRFADNRSQYINLMQLFEKLDEMYFDMCHYTDRGHEMIADKVYQAVVPIIQDLKKKEGIGQT